MVGVNVFAADTDAEARRLFTSLQQQFLDLVRGTPGSSPRQSTAWMGRSPAERGAVERMTRVSLSGPLAIRTGLTTILAETGADELILTAHIFDHAARLRSFQILAEVLFLRLGSRTWIRRRLRHEVCPEPARGLRHFTSPCPPFLPLLQEGVHGFIEGLAADVLVADNALVVDHVNRRPSPDAGPGGDRPAGAAAVPARPPGDLFLDSSRHGLVAVLVAIDPEQGERLVFQPLHQRPLVRVHGPARRSPVPPEVEDDHRTPVFAEPHRPPVGVQALAISGTPHADFEAPRTRAEGPGVVVADGRVSGRPASGARGQGRRARSPGCSCRPGRTESHSPRPASARPRRGGLAEAASS